MDQESARARVWWPWIVGTGGWVVVLFVGRNIVQSVIIGPQFGPIFPAWDFASLDIFGYMEIAVVLGIVAVLYVGIVSRLPRAPIPLWFGVVAGAGLMLVVTHFGYGSGLWPEVGFAAKDGIPAAGVCVGAYVGSRLFSRAA
jgi:hypothetical protein